MRLVFSYGSNLSTPRLAARITSFEVVAVARLSGYALRFHKHGRDGSGKADAFATGASEDRVWGVVHSMDDDAGRRLDAIEGVGSHYLSRDVEVRTRHGAALATTVYVAAPARIAPRLRPFDWYHAHVVAGAREHSLPPSYVASLQAIEVWPDDTGAVSERP